MKHRRIRATDDANFAFDKANFERSLDERDAGLDTSRHPEEPQPTLTPDGALREKVDLACPIEVFQRFC